VNLFKHIDPYKFLDFRWVRNLTQLRYKCTYTTNGPRHDSGPQVQLSFAHIIIHTQLYIMYYNNTMVPQVQNTTYHHNTTVQNHKFTHCTHTLHAIKTYLSSTTRYNSPPLSTYTLFVVRYLISTSRHTPNTTFSTVVQLLPLPHTYDPHPYFLSFALYLYRTINETAP
jgi:hypothetical protein